jgi:8-oxo-dGTP diphosphatase
VSSLHFNCALTTDCVVFSESGAAVLIRRKNPPFQGQYALPGGFVDEDETVEEACVREAKEETNLDLKDLQLVGVYSAPGRDPRGRTVSAAFMAMADLSQLCAGDDAAEVELVRNWQDKELAFDHAQILRDAWKLFSAES